jgi:hypothetical protein
MKEKFQKPNIIDIATILVVVLLVAIGAIYYLQKPKLVDTKLRVTIRVGNPEIARAILPQARLDKTVFLNSTNRPLVVSSVQEVTNDVGEFSALDISLVGPGFLNKQGNYIFNNQRILINQKAEVHGNYHAQGGIIKIENEN